MTCTEIDELIEYLEKNYHVKCEVEVTHTGSDRLVVHPNFPMKFLLDNRFTKEGIINHLDKLDLIRF